MKALDLFSGQRTALAAFKDWDITYIDIIDGNPIQDFCPDHIYDFMWASPMCNEYSLARPGNMKLIPDRELWLESLRVFDQGKRTRLTPWVIENVMGAQHWWGRATQQTRPYYFWGFFPHVNLPKGYTYQKDIRWGRHNKKTSMERSRIPYEISKAFYDAIENIGKPKDHKGDE